MASFEKEAFVRHARYGTGRVRLDDGDSVVVRFEHGVEECLAVDLEPLYDLRTRVRTHRTDAAVNVLSRVLANCILSVNDSWGVFSRSRIALLPHQLWVCKRVLETWPTRWMVADDVGLGKTIEAGLILTPLLSSGRVRRLLILAPASLVEQWQVRLRELFDIRLSQYAAGSDTPKSDYWNTHDKIVASAHTLRTDTGGRWHRLLTAEPWDLVLVDEAHHMNVDGQRGRTLSFQLVEQLQAAGRIHSMVFFTGTPHRGKDYGFLSLLKLLRPNDFDPKQPLEEQLRRLRTVMIRNNKQNVTDMQGRPIFTPVVSRREGYSYSPAEADFYDKLTDFIGTGKAYAARLGRQERRMVMLILIAMQKLASSSIAAVKRAMERRLAKLQTAKVALTESAADVARLEELLEDDDPANLDEIARLEERLGEHLADGVQLNPNEIPSLLELLDAAGRVTHETKIERILGVVEESYRDRAVLFFTEYKATQALLMSSLQARYGNGCVAFINGDGYLDGVRDSTGHIARVSETRDSAARRFNAGEVRFLVSTEAAGEGIDLQESCHTLIHVDLPWNPMRLHQRVGRLSRYGQEQSVDVVTFLNPATVESRIWDCLDRKLDRITLAFQGVMDDPEDMRQLVIGMASPRMFTGLFADADASLKGQRLEEWFDSRSATFGGADAVNTVRRMFGSVARFDFGEVVEQIPKVDLPDLVPFFKASMASLGKRVTQTSEVRLSFKTPEQFRDDFTMAERYDLLFARDVKAQKGEDIAGVGLRIVNRTIDAARETIESFAAVGDLEGTLVVFALRDRITGSDGPVRRVVVGLWSAHQGEWQILRDWQVLTLLNPLANKPRSPTLDVTASQIGNTEKMLEEAEAVLETRIVEIELPFLLPVIEPLAVLLPGVRRSAEGLCELNQQA